MAVSYTHLDVYKRQVTNCPGLKQWGTVNLANQGYSPIQILRYYYGSGVALYESNNIRDIPQSYPGTPLRVGSTCLLYTSRCV